MSKKGQNTSDERLRAKLDWMSAIDEEIIDRNTEKRFVLSNVVRKRARRRAWIPVVSAAAAFLFLFAAVLLLIPDKKQVPIYQGMTVSHTYTAKTDSGDGGEQLSRLAEGRGFFGAPVLSIRALNLWQDWEVDDILEYLSTLSTESSGVSESEQVSETVTETVTETETEKPSTLTDFSAKRYYATPGQDIYITIHFSNPDKFEILSFTLNGEKFSSYMFEAGSDMEHLVLKQNVGSECGLKEFTIDAIKYVDGTAIKDVRMDGDRTVEVGVYKDALPTTQASVTGTGYFDTTLSVSLTELTPTLLRLSEGKLRAAIYLGEREVAARDILPEEIGASLSIPFGNLLSGMDYRATVEATFDRQEGEGIQTYVLWQQTVHTRDALSVTVTKTEQESASFMLEWAKDYPQKEFTALALMEKDGTPVRKVDLSELTEAEDPEDPEKVLFGLTVGELLSNHEYILAVIYSNGESLGVMKNQVVTKAKTVPRLNCAEDTVDQTSFSFLLELNDPDGICTIESILLLNADKEPIGTYDTSVRSFSDLLSGTIYYVQMNYSYDLNDGSGRVSQSHPFRFATKAKTAPQYTISSTEFTQTSVSFDLTETDPDNVGEVTKIELLKDGEVVQTATDVNVRSFDDLTSKSVYTLRLTYSYDLNDGKGAQTNTEEVIFATLAQSVSMTDVQLRGSNVILPGDAVTVTFSVENPDGVTLTKAVVNGVMVELQKIAYNTYRFSYASSSEGGKEALCFTELIYSVGSVRVSQELNYVSSVHLIVRGTISLESITLPQKGIAYKGDPNLATLILKGSDAYENVTDIVLVSGAWSDQTEIEVPLNRVNETTFTFSLPADCAESYTRLSYWMQRLVCLVDTEETDVDLSGRIDYVVMDPSYKTVTDISTPEQLQTMESGRSYRLVNDIDLAGFPWQSYDFQGILDGNGFKIKNLEVYRYYGEGEAVDQGGLFGTLRGFIKDLTLENAMVTVEKEKGYLISRAGGEDLGVGILACEAEGILHSCRVEGTLTVIAGSITATSACGIVGGGDVLQNCFFNGNVFINGPLVTTVFGPYHGHPIGGDINVNCAWEGEFVQNGQIVPFDEQGNVPR